MKNKQYNPKTNEFFRKVYSWMFLGLLISAIVAVLIPTQFKFLLTFLFSSKWIYLGFFLFYLGFIWFISARVMKLSYEMGMTLFIIQAILMGIFLSAIFVIYQLSSIGLIFFITAVIFGLLALIGYFTKMDLSSLGPILFVGLIGIIIVSVINLFLGNSTVDLIISVIAVIIFMGFTMYDNYMLRKLSENERNNDTLNKLSIVGALALYLDFINLFLNLLSIFGDRN